MELISPGSELSQAKFRTEIGREEKKKEKKITCGIYSTIRLKIQNEGDAMSSQSPNFCSITEGNVTDFIFIKVE